MSWEDRPRNARGQWVGSGGASMPEPSPSVSPPGLQETSFSSMAGPYIQGASSKASARVARQIEDEAVRSLVDLIYIALQLGGVTLLAFTLLNIFVMGTWIQRAKDSGSVGKYFLGNTLGLSIPFGMGGNDKDSPMSGDTSELKVGDSVGTYKVTSVVGPRKSPGGVGSTNHQGADIATPIGTALVSPSTTTVECLNSGGGGTGARFDNGRGVVTLWHLSKCNGGRKHPGDSIGATGNTGVSTTGPHLHFEIKVGEQIVNPQMRDVAAVLGIAAGNGSTIQTAKLMEAIKSQESGGNPSAVNGRTGALGLWQVLPSNVLGWSKQCLGSPITASQFLASPETQAKIVECKLQEYATTHAAKAKDEEELVRRVASTWYSGNGDKFDHGAGQGPGGNEPSIREYTVSIWNKYQGN